MILGRENSIVRSKGARVVRDIFILKIESNYQLPLCQFSACVFRVLERFNVVAKQAISSGIYYTLIVQEVCDWDGLQEALRDFAKVEVFTGCAAVFISRKDRTFAKEFVIELNNCAPVMLISYDVEFHSLCVCVGAENIDFVQRIISRLESVA